MTRSARGAVGSAYRTLMLLTAIPLCLGQGCPGTPPPADSGPLAATIYGDGSAGDLIITADSSLASLVPDGNWQFRNITIAGNTVFSVPSGTTLRCTGTFTNNGVVLVGPGTVAPETAQVAHPGVSRAGAEPGEDQPSTIIAGGGRGGQGLIDIQALSLFEAPVNAGGAGGTSFLQQGARGGGGFRLLARGPVVNQGTIRADGDTCLLAGAGGGAGGVIILASPESILNAGAIFAEGGYGGPSLYSFGGGGGGSGGIVRFISPSIAAGAVSVAGGGGGSPSSIATDTTRHGGAGGGACGGDGGYGGSVVYEPLNTAHPGQPGEKGQIISTTADPTALFW